MATGGRSRCGCGRSPSLPPPAARSTIERAWHIVPEAPVTTLVVLQPSYLPWLGFFDQVRRCDRFVFYDDVQYDKHGWRNRNRIKAASGPVWLTVPVRTRGRMGQS